MYKLLYHDSWSRETSIHDFELLQDVCEYLYNRMSGNEDSYELLKITDDQFNLREMVNEYIQQRSALRAAALAKLSDEEKAVLGLTKA